MVRWICWIAGLIGLALLPASAQAPQRAALVIANATYAGYAPLPNTTVDSGLVADALQRAGFATVEVKTNLGIASFRTALGAFQSRAQGAEVAVIYYAGHAVEVNGRNWLIPTDASLENDGQLAFQAIDADLLVQAAAGARTRLVVLDACRENPFAGRMRRTGRVTRDASPGLAAPLGEGARGTLLMYSAAPGELAADGVAGRGSPFARAFARHLPEPGVELRVAAGKVADAVYAETNSAQLPFTSSSLSGAEIYLVADARIAPPDLEVERLRRELEALRRTSSAPPSAAARPVPSPVTSVSPPLPLISDGTSSLEQAARRTGIEGRWISDWRDRCSGSRVDVLSIRDGALFYNETGRRITSVEGQTITTEPDDVFTVNGDRIQVQSSVNGRRTSFSWRRCG